MRDRSEELAEILCTEIVEGRLAAGERLNEQDLARRLEVSRGPVREALRRLTERGLVTVIPNAGARVARPDAAQARHLFSVREVLEAEAAGLAARVMSDGAKADLRALLESHIADVETAEDNAYLQATRNTDFHYRIIEGSGNPVLFKILCGDLYPQLRLLRRTHAQVAGRGLRALEEHRRILVAIEEGDSETATLAMRKHVQSARTTFESAVERA